MIKFINKTNSLTNLKSMLKTILLVISRKALILE